MTPKPVFEVQTRDVSGELRWWSTLKEALAYAKENETVWKISFPVGPPENGERCRFVRSEEGCWFYEDIVAAVQAELEKK